MFGISVDYLNYIQEKLSTNFKLQEPRTQREIISALKSGEISFISSVSENSERSQYLLFTRPYISLPIIYIAKSGTKNKTGTEIVDKELRVSVSEDYDIHYYLSNRYPKMHLVKVENPYQVLQNVLSGVTEVGVINIATLSHLVREHHLANLKKIGETGFEIKLSFALPKSMPELRNIFDNIIETMPKKTKDAILSHWITDNTTIENLAGSATDLHNTNYNNENIYLVVITGLLMLCIGFILHYVFVRSTPKKDAHGETEYIP